MTESLPERAQEPASDPPANDPPRAWWQFSLRSLFVVVTLLVIVLAWYVNGPERYRRAVAALRASGATIWFAHNEPPYTGDETARVFPREYFERLHSVLLDTVPQGTELPPLQELVGLQVLTIDEGWTVDDASAASLAQLHELTHLTISKNGLTDQGLAHLASLESLVELDLNVKSVGDAGLEHLSRLTRLEKLRLVGWHNEASSAGYAALARLTNVKYLTLEFEKTGLTDEGLAHLCTLPRLEGLALVRAQATGEPFREFAARKTLRNLDLRGGLLADRSLAHLAGMDLEKLCLDDNPITDAGLAHLAELKVGRLLLAGTKISDAGLVHLRHPKVPGLWFVTVDRTKVTKRGVIELSKQRNPPSQITFHIYMGDFSPSLLPADLPESETPAP